MEHFNTITKLLGMKDQNITINDIVDCQTHKEITVSVIETDVLFLLANDVELELPSVVGFKVIPVIPSLLTV